MTASVGPTMRGVSSTSLVACPDCDLLHRLPPMQYGERAKCSRCGAVLYHKKRDTLDHTVALSCAGLVFFFLANIFPFMSFKLEGRVQSSVLISGVKELFVQDMWVVALLVLAVSIVIPLLKILSMLYVLFPLTRQRRLPHASFVFRWVEVFHPWAMLDVYMLGVIVAIVKLSDLATLDLGVALFSFGALIVTMAAADATLDSHAVWKKLEREW